MKNKPLLTIFLIVFIDLLGFSLILPLLPFIAEKYSANGFQIGLLTATYSFFQFVSSPILGRLSDKYGRKKLLIISQIGTLLGFALLGVANSLPLLFLSRVIDGATGGNISIAQAYIADITDNKNRAKGMGILGAAFGLGFIFGPAIGGILSRFGYAVPALFAVFISALSIAATYFLLEETVVKTDKNKALTAKFSLKELTDLFFKSGIGYLIVIFALLNLAFSAMQGNFSLYTQKIFNYGPEKNGYLFTFIGLASVFTQLKLLPFALQKTTEKTLFKLGLFILSFGFLLIPLAMHISTILLSILFIAVGNGFVNPTIQSIASENVSRDKYGETLGILQSMGSVGRIAGPIIGGELFLAVSAPAPFIFAGTIMLIIFAYAIWQMPEERTLLEKMTRIFKKS